MAKERDPDLQFPDEAAIEERVRRMMDVAAPDSATPKPQPPTTAAPAKSIPIVQHESTVAETPKIKPQPRAISVTDETEASAPTAPPVMKLKDETAAADQPASPSTTRKSIVIKHFSEGTIEPVPAGTAVAEPAPVPPGAEPENPTTESVTEEDMPVPVDNPLIPTEKLVSTIETAKSKKPAASPKPKKSTRAVAKPRPKAKSKPEPPDTSVISPKPISSTSTDDIEAEIAAAFAPDETEAIVSAEPPAETPIPTEETNEAPPAKTAPEISPETSEPVIEEPAPSSKTDPFTPLTSIRPHFPEQENPQAPLQLNDNGTTQMVNQLMIDEADQLLKLPVDPVVEPVKQPVPVKTAPRPSRRANLKKIITFIFVGIFLLALLIFAVPASRIKAFNAAGLHTSATITVFDQSSAQPLKDAMVTVGDKQARTNNDGRATITGLNWGKSRLSITRPAYAPVQRAVVLTWFRNKLAAVNLQPSGRQFNLAITDYVSGKAVKAELDSADGSANGDTKGNIKLTVDASLTKPFTATVHAIGYRSENITLDPSQAKQQRAVKLVIARRYAFISKQSGTYDVYAVDIDGQNQQTILKGTGNEQAATLALVSHPTDDVVALISNRTTDKAADGTPLSNLTVVNTRDGTATTVTKAAQLQIIDWRNDQLIYTQVAANSKATAADRQQLVSYNYKTKKTQTLATANYFNNVLTAGGKIFYAPASAHIPAANVGFFQINPDGSGRGTILPLEVWNVYRTSYDHLSLSVKQDWYDFKLGDKVATKQSTAPANLVNPVYVESADGQHALWIDSTTNQPVLMLYSKQTGKNISAASEHSVDYPLQWLSNSLFVYRLHTGQTVTDYIYSLDGTAPVKLQDVVDVSGLRAWEVP